MRVAHIVANSGSRFYCENCARDSGVARGLRARGHQVIVVPLYLAPNRDSPDLDGCRRTGSGQAGSGPVASERDGQSPVFYGAVRLYLSHRFPLLRRAPAVISRVLDSRPLLRLAERMSGATDASGLESLTLSMLRGEQGGQSAELEDLLVWLSNERPDIVHLSNCLLLGMARSIARRLHVPVTCSLQDEHTWIDAMEARMRAWAWAELGERAKDIALFLPASRFYAGFMRERLGVSPDRMQVVPIGVDVREFAPAGAGPPPDPPTIGYISRICAAMGADILVDAFIILALGGRFPGLRLRMAGGSTSADERFLRSLALRLARHGLLHRASFIRPFGSRDRIDMLRTLSVLSVPTRDTPAFGGFVLESLAVGVPVVQPRRGAFPEILADTGGGILYDPNTPESLAAALEKVLGDHQLLLSLGRAGQAAVRARHTAERMAEGLEEAFMRVLGVAARKRQS